MGALSFQVCPATGAEDFEPSVGFAVSAVLRLVRNATVAVSSSPCRAGSGSDDRKGAGAQAAARRETKGTGEYPAKRTSCRKECSDTVGVLGGVLRAMAALAMEKDCGCRPRGERLYRLWAVLLFIICRNDSLASCRVIASPLEAEPPQQAITGKSGINNHANEISMLGDAAADPIMNTGPIRG